MPGAALLCLEPLSYAWTRNRFRTFGTGQISGDSASVPNQHFSHFFKNNFVKNRYTICCDCLGVDAVGIIIGGSVAAAVVATSGTRDELTTSHITYNTMYINRFKITFLLHNYPLCFLPQPQENLAIECLQN